MILFIRANHSVTLLHRTVAIMNINDTDLQTISHSETLLINELSRSLEAKDKKIYKFGFGQSPFPLPASVVAELQKHAGRKDYMPVQGLAPLRQAVADFHTQVDKLDWQAQRVIIGAGSKILIYAVMAAFKQADVLLVAPSWVSYEPQAKLCGHTVYRIQTSLEDNWRLTPESLERCCNNRKEPHHPMILVLNYPGNPDGLTYTASELERLATVCRDNKVLLISDEIYGLLNHKGEHQSIARYYPEGTIVTTGLSKWCGAGGWRLGVCHVPLALGDALMQRMLGIASETWSCVCSPIQLAAIKAYDYNSEIQQHLAKQRKILARLGRQCSDALNDANIVTPAPQGGFYLFPDFELWRDQLASRGINTSTELTRAILQQTGVALLPGEAFGMPASSLTVRLSYVDFDGGKALACYSDNDKLDQVTAKVNEGIKAMIDWLA